MEHEDFNYVILYYYCNSCGTQIDYDTIECPVCEEVTTGDGRVMEVESYAHS